MRGIELRAEYGSVEQWVFWSCEVSENSLCVACGDRRRTVALTAEQCEGFFREAEKCRVAELPASDYEADLTDDLYHMGVSVTLRDREGRTVFRHKVPTGQLVMVATRRVSKKQYLSFSLFVHAITKVSGGSFSLFW